MGVSYGLVTRIFRKMNTAVASGGQLIVNRTHIFTGGAGTVTLPASGKSGDRIVIIGAGSGAFTIGQNAGQSISHLSSNTTTGVGGTLAGATQRDCIELVCTADDGSAWTVLSHKGTFTVA